MAYGNNTKGRQPRSHFQEAGGAIIKFKHPYLAGQLANGIDTMDVSASLKLAETYFNATPSQDSAQQVVLIDGSTVTITNKLLNGVLTLPIIPTTGLVASGDFIACLQLIKSVGDNIGGVLTLTEHVDGRAITTIYYGVTVKNLPDKIKMGMDVPTYSCQLVYAGWIQAVSTSGELNKKAIWASGSQSGLEAYFKPYGINAVDGEGTGTDAVNVGVGGVEAAWADETGDTEKNINGVAIPDLDTDYAFAKDATKLTV